MKKVLSVLLAAAMVMGMSVSAMAAAEDKEWGKGPEAGKSDVPVVELEFGAGMFVSRKGSEHGFELCYTKLKVRSKLNQRRATDGTVKL